MHGPCTSSQNTHRDRPPSRTDGKRVCLPVTRPAASNLLRRTNFAVYWAHFPITCTVKFDTRSPQTSNIQMVKDCQVYFGSELSVGLFSSTQPNPAHQITDPTNPTHCRVKLWTHDPTQPIPNRTPKHRTTTGLP